MSNEIITFGAGCFWCTEAVFQQLPGVVSAVSGYMGGARPNPSYEQVCSGASGHVEVTQITYDTAQTNLEHLLEVFWQAHDPTSIDRQGNDVGSQYRSAIFYHSESQLAAAEASKAKAAPMFTKPIVTEILPAQTFWPAEECHQNYYQLNKTRNPYCQVLIAPKLRKLGLQS